MAVAVSSKPTGLYEDINLNADNADHIMIHNDTNK